MIETPHTPIFKCTFGSRLYGVITPTSDYDYKEVYVVNKLKDFMRHRGVFDSFNTVGVEKGEKAETESHYIMRFADLLGQMQTICMTMLWAPKNYWVLSSPAWEELYDNRDRMTAKSVMPYIGYARSQAVKYSLKANRLTALKDFQRIIKLLPQRVKLDDGDWALVTDWAQETNAKFPGDKDITRLWTSPTGEPMVEVCGKSFSRFVPVERWTGPIKSLVDNYGDRAKDAVAEFADLKACYHAVRIAKEAMELLTEGKITYPRPEAPLLLEIRQGKYTFDELKEIIDVEIQGLYAIKDSCNLPDQPNKQWLKDWAIRWQLEHW